MDKHIFIVRHGQTDNNAKQIRYDNHTEVDDVPLNKMGLEQAYKSGEYLKQFGKFDIVISSPRLRCLQTAEQICDAVGYNKNNIITNDLLLEGKAGVFNNMNFDKLEKILNSDKDLNKIDEQYNILDPINKALNRKSVSDKLWKIRNKKYKESKKSEIEINYEKFIEKLVGMKHNKILIIGHSFTLTGLIGIACGIDASMVPKSQDVDEYGNCRIVYLQYSKTSPKTGITKKPQFYLMTRPNNEHLKK